MNRYEQKRKYRRIRRKKSVVIIGIICLLIVGIIIVDNSFAELMCINKKKVVDISCFNNKYIIELFGKVHIIEKEDILQCKELIVQKSINVIDYFKKALDSIIN